MITNNRSTQSLLGCLEISAYKICPLVFNFASDTFFGQRQKAATSMTRWSLGWLLSAVLKLLEPSLDNSHCSQHYLLPSSYKHGLLIPAYSIHPQF